MWWADRVYSRILFNTLSDNGSKNLKYVRQLIQAHLQRKNQPNLVGALEYLSANYPQDPGNYDQVYFVLFISQSLDQTVVNSAKPHADSLNKLGRLTIIALGHDVDLTGAYLKQLTPTYATWNNPVAAPIMPHWETTFWNMAYGCSKFPNFFS
jgi:hypothetical protein